MSNISNAASKLGRVGGKANVEKNGKEHMRDIANKRWAKEKEKSEAVDNTETPTE